MKNKIIAFVIVTIFCLAYGYYLSADMPNEKITFDAPQQGVDGATVYKPITLTLDRQTPKIAVTIREVVTSGVTDYSGRHLHAVYTGDEALNLINIINTKNFSPPNDSLATVILKKLLADGKIPGGTVSED